VKLIKNNIWSIIIVLLSSILAFYYISEKEGFHEDEIFSYGSSNYRYDNIYKSFGPSAADLDYFHNHILNLTFPNNFTESINFLNNKEEYQNEFNETLTKEIPIWKTKEDLLEYLTIKKTDIWNYFSVWINQTIDVHPPLFYFAVHFISSFSMNHFSKYSIFIVNFIFFLLTLLGIYKIVKKLTNQKWANLAIFFYGTSIGAMNTVLFQRMYMMLTAFFIWYLYYSIKFLKEKFTKKDKILYSFIIFSGFLTQYYFCIYCVLIFIMMSYFLMKEKNLKKLKTIFFLHLIPALLGILLFPASISHIFFSYRGIGSTSNKSKTFPSMLFYFIKNMGSSIGLSFISLFILLVFLIILGRRKKENQKLFWLLLLPIIIFLFMMAKLSPFLGENYTSRYIMPLFPIFILVIIYTLNTINKQNIFKISSIFIIFLSIFQIFHLKPVYLFSDYKEAISISLENQDKYFMYIFDNYFTHLKDLPEMLNYKRHKIINHNIYDFTLLKEDEELMKQGEFILCIKSWINEKEILEKIIENTDFKKVTLIKEIEATTSSKYFKLSK